MDSQQKEFVKLKIKANKQRNQREKLIKRLPAHIATVLEQAEYIVSPAYENIVQTVLQRWNGKIYTYNFRFKYPQFVKAFSWEKDVEIYVQGLASIQGDIYLSFGVPNSPVFVVDGRWVQENFAMLWKMIEYEDIWVIGKEFDKGIVVSNFVGYLMEDPNPSEVYYEVLKWGFKHAKPPL